MWVKASFHKGDEIIEGEIAEDGLLVRVEKEKVQHILDKYPSTDEGWFFNETLDRFIADLDGQDRVVANPRLFWNNDYTIKT